MKRRMPSRSSRLWQSLSVASAVGCFAVTSAIYAQVPNVPSPPDIPDVNAGAATEAAADVQAEVQDNVQAEANTNLQSNVTVDAPNAVDANTNADATVNAEAAANSGQDAAGRVATDIQTDADANVNAGTEGAAVARGNFNSRARMGADVATQDGRLTLSNLNSQGIAAQAGLRANDEIVSINGQQIRTQAQYETALRNATGPVDIEYRRDGQVYTSQLAWNADQPQRHESFYRGANPSQNNPVQHGNAAQKTSAAQKGSAVQKGYGYAYYSDAGCAKHRRHRCHHHRHRRACR